MTPINFQKMRGKTLPSLYLSRSTTVAAPPPGPPPSPLISSLLFPLLSPSFLFPLLFSGSSLFTGADLGGGSGFQLSSLEFGIVLLIPIIFGTCLFTDPWRSLGCCFSSFCGDEGSWRPTALPLPCSQQRVLCFVSSLASYAAPFQSPVYTVGLVGLA